MRKESLLECWVCEEEVEKMLVEVNQIHPDYNCIKEETATHEPSPNSIELDKTRLRWSCCSGGWRSAAAVSNTLCRLYFSLWCTPTHHQLI